MYANWIAGHVQPPVSRRATATVDMHWHASTKNTIRLMPISGEYACRPVCGSMALRR